MMYSTPRTATIPIGERKSPLQNGMKEKWFELAQLLYQHHEASPNKIAVSIKYENEACDYTKEDMPMHTWAKQPHL